MLPRTGIVFAASHRCIAWRYLDGRRGWVAHEKDPTVRQAARDRLEHRVGDQDELIPAL
jgi:hypothetical protein